MKEELARKYQALVHAMQTGVMYLMHHGDEGHTPKHLRVGVNVALVEQSALTKLLVEKGIITEDELYDAIIKGHEEEVKRYEEAVEKAVGVKVVLG